MKTILFISAAFLISMIPATTVNAGSGSEACVTHCTDAASAHYDDGTKEWSAFFNGCMMTCRM